MRSPSSLSSSTNNSNSFFNLYFLLVALSQFVPALKIGFIVTYIAPLAFVLCVTMGKEAYDDYKRNMRDREANSQRYLILTPPPSPQSYSDEEQAYLNTHANTRSVPPSYLRVGDLVHLVKNSEFQQTWYCSTPPKPRGHVSIRTDQLDGETDWKLRVAVPECQKMDEGDLVKIDAEIYGVYDFLTLFSQLNEL